MNNSSSESLDYRAGMVYGYLLKMGKSDLSIKIGAIALALNLTPSQVCDALDSLKTMGRVEMFATAATIQLKERYET